MTDLTTIIIGIIVLSVVACIVSMIFRTIKAIITIMLSIAFPVFILWALLSTIDIKNDILSIINDIGKPIQKVIDNLHRNKEFHTKAANTVKNVYNNTKQICESVTDLCNDIQKASMQQYTDKNTSKSNKVTKNKQTSINSNNTNKVQDSKLNNE